MWSAIVILTLLQVNIYCVYAANVDAAELAMYEEQAARTSIVAYKKNQMTYSKIQALHNKLELDCQCDVEHLPHAGMFILTYPHQLHSPAVNLESVDGVAASMEDMVLTIPKLIDGDVEPFNSLDPLQDRHDQSEGSGGFGTHQGGSATDPEVIVAVMDTGVDYNHPDLRDVMWKNPKEIAGNNKDDDGNGIVDDVYGADFSSQSGGVRNGNPIDRNSHGTHCAGIIAAKANNQQGIAGVASFTKGKVKIMAIKIFSDNGFSSHAGMIKGLNYAIGKGAKLSSNSWGTKEGFTIPEKYWPGIHKTWDVFFESNPHHLFVAAAGNSNFSINKNKKVMPCSLEAPNMLCVASSDKTDSKSYFSNTGNTVIHVFAPGSDIYSTIPNNRYKSYQGTSMACPQVSGLAALVMTMRSNLKGGDVKKLIMDNVQKKAKYAQYVSTGGLIDVEATIKAVKNTGPPGQPTPCENCKTPWVYCKLCPLYAWLNYCAYPWYKKNCKKSCNTCSSGDLPEPFHSANDAFQSMPPSLSELRELHGDAFENNVFLNDILNNVHNTNAHRTRGEYGSNEDSNEDSDSDSNEDSDSKGSSSSSEETG